MKKQYKILALLIAFEFIVLFILKELNVQVQSWLGNAVGIIIFSLPVEILLFLCAKDENLSPKKRMFCKIVFWFISICFISGGAATLLNK